MTLYSIRLIGGYRTPWDTLEQVEEAKKRFGWQVLGVESIEVFEPEEEPEEEEEEEEEPEEEEEEFDAFESLTPWEQHTLLSGFLAGMY